MFSGKWTVTGGQLHLPMGYSGLVGEKLSPILSATSWEPAASLCLPSECFTCPLANPRLFRQAVEQQIGGGAAQQRAELVVCWQGPLNCSKHWSWQGLRVKQVKGCSHLKERKDGWRTGVGKGVKRVNFSGMVREMVFASIFFCLRALLLNDKDTYPWFP